MGAVGEYIFSVCGAAVLCAVLTHFLKNGSEAGIGKMVAGLVLLLTVLRPLCGEKLPLREFYGSNFQLEAQLAVDEGKENTDLALRALIKEQCAAYILQKADALGLELEIEVEVTDEALPVPQRVYIFGTAAPYARQQLQQYIRQELGIAKENQIWT